MKIYIQLITGLLLGCLLLGSQTLSAQSTESEKTPIKIRLDVFNKDNLMGFDVGSLQVYDPVSLRPGASLSAEFTWKQKNNRRMYSSALLGANFSPYNERHYYVGSITGMEYLIKQKFIIAPILGFQAGLVQTRDVQYQYNGEIWEPIDYAGRTFFRGTGQLGLDLGYRLNVADRPVDLLLNGSAYMGGPYLDGPEFILWMWQSVGVGVRVGL